MMDDLSRPLDENELDELHRLLLARADDEGLLLDGVHGLVSALAAGPEAVPPDEWMPLAIGADTPFASPREAERVLALVARLFNGVVHDLERDTYAPILGEIDDGEGTRVPSARGWCEGFSLGVELRASLWESRMHHDPALLELLAPVMRLGAEDGLFGGDEEPDPAPLSAAEYDAAMRAIGHAVCEVQRYWRAQPPCDEELDPEDEAPPPRRLH